MRGQLICNGISCLQMYASGGNGNVVKNRDPHFKKNRWYPRGCLFPQANMLRKF